MARRQDGRHTARARGVALGAVVALVATLTALVASPPASALTPVARVNFQAQSSAVPAGYTADFGQGFDATRGYGWVQQGSSTPLSLAGNGRDRNAVADQRLDTFMHMQFTGASGGVAVPGRWEHALPNGSYSVTVSVGDPSFFDSIHRLSVEGTLAVDNFVPTAAAPHQQATVTVDVTDGRLTLDAAGGSNTKIDYVDIDSLADPPPPASVPARVNFQPQGAPVPSGYVADFGQAYDTTRGYGWIGQTNTNPLSLVGNGRDRNAVADQRLDTFMHMQYPAASGGVQAPGRWQYAVPDGSYNVTVSVGEASFLDSVHRITVEGSLAINNFVPTASERFRSATVTVNVTDGFITLDAAGGSNTKINYVDIDPGPAAGPHVVDVDPNNGATDVSTSASVTLVLSVPSNPATISGSTVQLVAPGNVVVPGTYNSDAAGSLVSFTPSAPLAMNTSYLVRTTAGLQTTDGTSFEIFQSTFTTGTAQTPPASLAHTRTTFADVPSATSVALGPDGRLYVANGYGQLLRFTVNPDGTAAGAPLEIDHWTFQRTITGIAFDPASTPSNLKLWVSHGELGNQDMANFTGKVSVLTGSNLENMRDVIVGLPRSVADHMNNGITFGPDGRLYLAQGSLNGYGAPDRYWGFRPEAPLSAAILAADVNGDSRFATTPVDVTTDAPTAYNPFDANAPVKLYATGTRNPYDLVWHSGGKLFVPINESANGNAPAGPGNNPPALNELPGGRDFVSQVKAGRYYGHPNPSRGEYVLNGGNPTSGVDYFEQPQYPVGQQPDADWDAPILDLGLHRSANGITEFKSDAWGGQITGDLLLVEFSNGDDILVLDTAVDGSISQVRQLAVGFNNPLDVTSDDENGDIWVAEYGSQPEGEGGRITLIRPSDVTTVPEFRVNFQSETAAVPAGYDRDFGQAYDATRGYGWVSQASSTPLSMVGFGRDRNVNPDQRLDTFMHMQPSGSPSGRWEHEVPDGRYLVTVAVGDASFVDSTHRVTVEGVVAVNNVTPNSEQRHSVRTVEVDVTDGRMTFDAAGGTNTKIDYVDVDRVANGDDIVDPTVAVDLAGTQDGSGNYQGSAQVSISATDDDSGVNDVSYTLDGGPSTPYTTPFTVTTNGSHTVVATATDVAGNQGQATRTFTIVGGSGPNIAVTTPEDVLGLPSRLVFSTVNEEARPAKAITVRNTGTGPLTVSSIAIAGQQAGDFRLATGQATAFTIPAGGSVPVNVEFRPAAAGVENFSTLTITSNDPDQPALPVALAGLDANDYEGNNEPRLAQISRVLGYSTNIGTENVAIGRTRLPVGDELITPYFNRADPTKPVTMFPLAHFSGRTTTAAGQSGWHNAGSTTKNQLFSFPGGSDVSGGQNQRILPSFTGTTTFNPAGTFGLYGVNDWSDDARNGGARLHNLRMYPAKGPGGAVIPNTWLVGDDLGNDINSTVKNYDYQDQVYLLVNATPATPTAAAPGAATTLEFDSAVAGTVLDNDGQGTGFPTFTPNSTGGGLDASRIDLAGGRLSLTSTAGTFSGSGNTQVNALQMPFDASRQKNRLHTRLVGPMSKLTAANQHQALVFGPDRNNFIKFEAEFRSGSVHILTYFEQNGTGTLPVDLTLPNAASVNTLDLFLTLDTASGQVTASYLVNSDDFNLAQPIGPAMSPSDVMRWFSTDARGGVLVGNENTTTAFTGVFERFSVQAASTPGFTTLSWSQQASTAQARAEAQGIAVDGRLYVFGGYPSGTNFTPMVRSDAYNPTTNTWTRIADMPVATTHGGVAAIGRSIYVAGGYITNGGTGQIFATTNVYRYDIDTNSWTKVTSLPAARGSGGLVARGTNLHFFGGADINRVDRGEHWIWDTAGAGGWVASTNLPTARSHLGYALVNGMVYAVGGQTGIDAGLTVQTAVHAWDPARNQWVAMANLPRGRSHISSATFPYKGQLVVIGGEVLHGQSINEVTVYDPASNSWRSSTTLPQNRFSGVAGDVGGNRMHYATGSFTTQNYRGTTN
jgi:N-acetylneuraminic acid mutarotase